MHRLTDVRNAPGVYLFVDLDERPLYVGKSLKVRARLQQHLVLQNSSATADGLLDLFDILQVFVWYCEPLEIDDLEAAAFRTFAPRWNRAGLVTTSTAPRIELACADVVVQLPASEAQLTVRRDPMERVEAKLLHLLRAVRKAKVSGTSAAIDEALGRHASELSELITRATRSSSGIGLASDDDDTLHRHVRLKGATSGPPASDVERPSGERAESASAIQRKSRNDSEAPTSGMVNESPVTYDVRASRPQSDRPPPSIRCRVSYGGRGGADRQILFYAVDRSRMPGIPEGDTPVVVNGDTFIAGFRRIAVNSLRRPMSDGNELSRVLTGWFGEDAGHPGNRHRVIFEWTNDRYVLHPIEET